jgi:hypothetical protein
MNEKLILVSKISNYRPVQIFDVLSNPKLHKKIDGSRTIIAYLGSENSLKLNSKFKMLMHIKGIPYWITNTVIMFENIKLIGWQHFGKNKWIYKLEEIDGKTKVTHIFDWSKSLSEKSVQFFIKQNKANMSNSLNKLEEFLNRIYT